MKAVAVAHPNIALAKYWGKREGEGNYPAVPSLSVTLRGMKTRTRVAFGRKGDHVVLGGTPATGEPRARVVTLLDRVRSAAGLGMLGADVESTNDFPTASGLASSASGFAALALAATRAAGLAWDDAQVSDLARRSSASAARSVLGGFVELLAGPVTPSGEPLAARQVAPPGHLDVALLVCVTSEGAKVVGSTDGMRETASRSPYYPRWLSESPPRFEAMRAALLARDVEALGALTEASAFEMHACAMAAGVVYVGGATGALLAAVRALRARGIGAWATMDAGPHVKVLVRGADLDAVRAELGRVPGVLRTIDARPGEGARVVEDAP